MTLNLTLTALALVLGLAFVYMIRARQRALIRLLECPYQRARMLYRLERRLSKSKGITLAEYYASGSARNRARMPIAAAKDTRLIDLYKQRCLERNKDALLEGRDRDEFNAEARRIDAFYPDRPGAL